MFWDPDVAICVRGATDFQNFEDVPSETARNTRTGRNNRLRALLPRRGAYENTLKTGVFGGIAITIMCRIIAITLRF